MFMEQTKILGDDLLYEQVAGRIEQMIEKGVLRAGEKIPSVRSMSRQQNVSMSTAFQAYFLLESKGLIESRPRSGFFVRLANKDLPPQPNRTNPPLIAKNVNIDEMVAEVFEAARHPDIVPLGAACPSPAILPVNKLNRITIAILRDYPEHTTEYEFPPGNELLRRRIAQRSFTWGGNLSANDIVITSGCMEALNLCLRAVAKPGDTIVLESPTYYGILQTIQSLGMRALEVATTPNEGLCLEALEKALNNNDIKACLVVTNFNNPMGSCMPTENKKKLVEMLGKRNIPLIEDDLYGELHFGCSRPQNAKAFDKKGLVLLCSSFSKSLAPGYRVGWVVPGKFKTKVERLKSMTTIATSTLPQMVIAEFLKNGSYERHLNQLRKAFCEQMQATLKAICKYFPEGTKVTRPTGGFVLWVELPKQVDALELHNRALEKKISIAPGPIFSATRKYNNFIRISCGNPWSKEIEVALIELGRLAKQF
jgi:DNA-binding transcriptional MocR family regulator